MKKVFEISFLIIAIVMCLFTPSVSALSEYYYADWVLWADYLPPYQWEGVGIHGFTHKAEVNIQTEANGKWILDKTYTITFIISITYLNHTFFSPEAFHVIFFEPELDEQGWLRSLDIVTNSCRVDETHSGTLVATYTPTKSFTHLDDESRTSYTPKFSFKVFKNNEAVPYDYVVWQWRGDHPISITFEEETNGIPDYTTPIIYICIGIAIVAVPIGTYLIYKSRKSKERYD